MPKLLVRQPKYCRLSGRNVAYYWREGRRIYLPGLYGSNESIAAYHKEMALWAEERAAETSDKKLKPFAGKQNQLTVAELVAQFLVWADENYVKDGKPTGAADQYEYATRIMIDKFGDSPASEFTQQELIAVQDAFKKNKISRQVINDRVARIKRIFNWGVSQGLVSIEVALKLKFVEPLKKGIAKVIERPKVKPVSNAQIKATLPHLSPVVADMVRLQRSTGMRPGEVFVMRWRDIDKKKDIWLYWPESHKLQHRDIGRAIPLNRRCQKVLARYSDTPPDDIIFSPKRTLREKSERLAESRKTKRQPSQVERAKKQLRPEQYVGEMYNRNSYRTAVTRAAQKAGVEHWFPYQLRHAFATEVEHRYGKKAARAFLGHTNEKTTEIYLQRNIKLATEIAKKMDRRIKKAA